MGPTADPRDCSRARRRADDESRGATAADANYPDWRADRVPVKAAGVAARSLDPSKPAGPGQQAPLTPEYQKVLQDSMAVQANGGLGNDPTAQCYAAGCRA